MRNLLTAEQVASRLGVQLKTVYAYVSRGVLQRTLSDDGKKSLFEPAAVEQLARRGRPRQGSRPVGSVDVSITSTITAIQSERLLYRGHDVRTLVGRPFEVSAELLWSGELPETVDWPRSGEAAASAVGLSLKEASPATERLALITAAFAARTPLRVDLQPAAVMRHARLLLATFIDGLPPLAAETSGGKRASERFAARLWPRVSAAAPTSQRIACLDTALVLLADHELATSTLAARVAASTRADPCAVVLSGLGALSGPLHGKAALVAHELLLRARALGSGELAVAQTLARRELVPGFGHPVYRGIDPRAQCLLERVLPQAKRADRAIIAAVQQAGQASTERQANVDFALAALAFSQDMPVGATEAIFAVARSAGWIAHALEEYGEQALRFRGRALYVGTLPSSA